MKFSYLILICSIFYLSYETDDIGKFTIGKPDTEAKIAFSTSEEIMNFNVTVTAENDLKAYTTYIFYMNGVTVEGVTKPVVAQCKFIIGNADIKTVDAAACIAGSFAEESKIAANKKVTIAKTMGDDGLAAGPLTGKKVFKNDTECTFSLDVTADIEIAAPTAEKKIPYCTLGYFSKECTKCNKANLTLCGECQEKEYLNITDLKCITTPSCKPENKTGTCVSCDPMNDAICKDCVEGDFLREGKCFKKCVTGNTTHCKACDASPNEDLCKTCDPGYVIEDNNITCRVEEEEDSSNIMKFGKLLLLLFFILA